MPHYTVTAVEVASGATPGTYKTLLAVKFPASSRQRIRSLSIGPGGEAAQDVNMSIRLTTADQTGDGTSTAVTVKQKDTLSRATSASAAGKNFTAEPSNLAATYHLETGLNSRGSMIKEWNAEEAPVIPAATTVVLQATPGAASAVKLTCTLEWEEF
jgi:hypothetical protein